MKKINNNFVCGQNMHGKNVIILLYSYYRDIIKCIVKIVKILVKINYILVQITDVIKYDGFSYIN